MSNNESNLHSPHSHFCFGYKQPVPGMSMGFAPTAAKDSAPLHIHSNHSINTHKHPTPTPLGKVYTRILAVPSGPLPLTKGRSSMGCAQAPHRLASRWYPFSIHSSEHCAVSSRTQLIGDLVPFLAPLEGRWEEKKKQERNSEVQREFPLQILVSSRIQASSRTCALVSKPPSGPRT